MAKSKAEMMKALRERRKAEGLQSLRIWCPEHRAERLRELGVIFGTPDITPEQLKYARSILRSLGDE